MDTVSRFFDHFNLPWLLLALMSWSLIFIFCSRECFRKGYPVGIWTMITAAVLEHYFITQKLWIDRFIMVHVGELDLFLIIGPYFAIGLLMIRFLSANRWGRLATVLILSGLATGVELIAIQLGALEYNPGKWGTAQSMVAYVLGLFSALGFFYSFGLNRQKP